MIELEKLGLKKLEKRKPISQTPEYKAWTKMKERCLNPKTPNYCDYGGRGISICNEWLDDPYKFLKDMGEKPKPKRNYSLERINNSKGYSKDNCKWADKKEQANNRRSNIILEYKGVSMNATQWAEALGIKPHTLLKRIRDGWSIEKALTYPIQAS